MDPGILGGMTLARQLWQAYEPYHAIVYWAPEARSATDALGCWGYWMGYFGMRAAPLGPAPAAVVAATFYGFHPAMVARGVPEVWRRTTPAAMLAARLEAMDAALRRVLGEAFCASPEVARAAQLCAQAAAGAEYAGRPLGAANAALTLPEPPHLALWQATTTLREHRGDGHVAALVHAGLSPVQSHITAAGSSAETAARYATYRHVSAEEWTVGVDGLRSRGWLDARGEVTAAGRAGRAAIEAATDDLAEQPWRALGAARTREALDLLAPVARKVFETGAVPRRNPIGVTPASPADAPALAPGLAPPGLAPPALAPDLAPDLAPPDGV